MQGDINKNELLATSKASMHWVVLPAQYIRTANLKRVNAEAPSIVKLNNTTQLEQCIQASIFMLNTASRWSVLRQPSSHDTGISTTNTSKFRCSGVAFGYDQLLGYSGYINFI
jgi:hypothetical protein